MKRTSIIVVAILMAISFTGNALAHGPMTQDEYYRWHKPSPPYTYHDGPYHPSGNYHRGGGHHRGGGDHIWGVVAAVVTLQTVDAVIRNYDNNPRTVVVQQQAPVVVAQQQFKTPTITGPKGPAQFKVGDQLPYGANIPNGAVILDLNEKVLRKLAPYTLIAPGTHFQQDHNGNLLF